MSLIGRVVPWLALLDASGDAMWHDTELLLLANEGAGSALTDQGTRSRTLTASGNAALSATNTDWASCAAAFDGTGDYWTVGGAADDFRFLHDGSQWELEVRLRRPTSTSQTVTLIDNAGATSANVGVWVAIDTSRKIRLLIGRNASGAPLIDFTSTAAWPNDSNYHDFSIAFVYDPITASNNVRWWLDGALQEQASRASAVRSTVAQTRPLLIGRVNGVTTLDMLGNISFLRLTQQVRHSAANYTPITQPAPKIVSSSYPSTPIQRRYAMAPGSGAQQYASEPQMVQCNDGTVVMIYRRGSAHVSNDGIVFCRRSATLGRTWGTEITVHDHSSGKDTRNPAIGVDPSSGRLIAFSSTYDAPTLTHLAVFFQTSTDNGATWSAATDITSSLSGCVAAYGRTVSTTNGLMQLFYTADKCVALFSTDGGQNWGGAVTVYNRGDGAAYNEPVVLALSASNLLTVSRLDSGNKDQYGYYKSTDGGSTWSSLGVYDYTSATWTQAAPAWHEVKANGDVLVAWIARDGSVDPPGRTFWISTEPSSSYFADPTTGRASPVSIDPLYINYGSVSTGTDAEYGYPNLLQLSGGGNMLIAWHDMLDGTNARTCIYVRSLLS